MELGLPLPEEREDLSTWDRYPGGTAWLVRPDGLVPGLWGLNLFRAGSLRPINTRAESLLSKPFFSNILLEGLVWIPCNGFWEWMPSPEGKRPCFIHQPQSAPMLLMGLSSAGDAQGTPLSFSVVTRPSSPSWHRLHPRMPVMLPLSLPLPPWPRTGDTARGVLNVIRPHLLNWNILQIRAFPARTSLSDLRPHEWPSTPQAPSISSFLETAG